FCFFFFQAEDGIRDRNVTGVQTCALPIWTVIRTALDRLGYPDEVFELMKEPIRMLTVRIPVRMDDGSIKIFTGYRAQHNDAVGRSEERRVGKECRSRMSLDKYTQKRTLD